MQVHRQCVGVVSTVKHSVQHVTHIARLRCSTEMQYCTEMREHNDIITTKIITDDTTRLSFVFNTFVGYAFDLHGTQEGHGWTRV